MSVPRYARLLLAGLMFVSAHAAALRIDLVPATPTVSVGGTAQLSVVMSGFASLNQILSGWSFGLTFDPAIVAFGAFAFGAELGGGAGVVTGATAGQGSIDLFAVSLLTDAELDALQGDAVTLGVLTFTGLAPGISSLSFVEGLFGLLFTGRSDGGSPPLPVLLETDVGGGRITVVPNAVPLPSTLALLLLGFALLRAFVRR